MTMTLAERNSANPAQRLRVTTAAVRVSIKWLGVRKTLTPEQRSQAAETFDAAGEFLSARKKLLDTSHAAYKEVTAVRGNVIKYWKSVTLPYPEAGVRLIRQEQIETFDSQMQEFRSQLVRPCPQKPDRGGEVAARPRRSRAMTAHILLDIYTSVHIA